eukprot:CAMPEP_0184514504 /NCGR_PEP_ID=MMETSP0198_2-20121128/4002_1 /TAXON_ID=1112570 /ORGANISM="Thraustochytrium sp., Strain LLF1b" /LENGTH=318 /DNA_ID=CAMNT_0026904705 /DNA_START=924 /DNA_END=1880 /DNA_ORIENTATION=-
MDSHGPVLQAVRKMVPDLAEDMHKGQAGRIAVVGGSFEYTGAPYYASMSTLKAGGDLAFVICTEHAAVPIKAYSPELIVLPGLSEANRQSAIDLLPKAHALVVGPGLGRDPSVFAHAKELIERAKEQDIPIVLDGDALFMVSQDFSFIAGYSKAVLTPNVMELSRLYKAAFEEDPPAVDFDKIGKQVKHPAEYISLEDAKTASDLAAELGHVTILQKGKIDIITNGKKAIAVTATGSPRRCGGQGDILAGTSGLFAHWAVAAGDEGSLLLAATGSSVLTRTAAKIAFKRLKRAMNTPDAIEDLGEAMEEFFSLGESNL